MAKNRKNGPAAVRFGSIVKTVLLCAFFCGSALGYIWQKKQIFALGQRIEKLERDLQTAKQKNKERRDQLAYLQSPRAIDERVKELKLGLGPAQPAQVMRVVEVYPEAPAQVYAKRMEE